jgi:MscS family membrane protein
VDLGRLPGAALAAAAIVALWAPAARAEAGEVPSRTGALTPRAVVEEFLGLTDAGDVREASRLFDASNRGQHELERLTRRLRAVLDQEEPIDLDELSSSRDGDLDDKLPPDRERYTPDPREPDGPGSLLLVRGHGDAGDRWLISRQTMSRVDGWYHRLPSRWLVERLPPAFSRPGPLGVQPWQWLAIGGALVIALLLAFICGRLSGITLRFLARRTRTRWDDLAVARLRGPFLLAWFIAWLRVLLPLAGIPEHAFSLLRHGMRGALAAALFWAMIASVEAARAMLADAPSTHAGQRALLGIGGRLLKMVLFLVALVVILAQLGFSVTSLVAGIGVGGLGLALAAQKTVENVFGAFSLGVDQPFREGDVVLIDGITGTIERIGLRSTRIRTLDRTLVAIPNGKLAEMKTETLTARDRFRMVAVLPLQLGTEPGTLRTLVADIEGYLRGHPKASIDAQAVLTALTATSMDLEARCSFLTTDGEEFMRIRQEVLLGLLEVVERSGARWAAPPPPRPQARPT